MIKREFMKEFGDMTVREIVVLLPSIFTQVIMMAFISLFQTMDVAFQKIF